MLSDDQFLNLNGSQFASRFFIPALA